VRAADGRAAPAVLQRLGQVRQRRVRAGLHRQLVQALADFRAADLENRPLGARRALLLLGRQHAQQRDLQRGELDLDLRDLVAKARVSSSDRPFARASRAIAFRRRSSSLQCGTSAMPTRSWPRRNLA